MSKTKKIAIIMIKMFQENLKKIKKKLKNYELNFFKIFC